MFARVSLQVFIEIAFETIKCELFSDDDLALKNRKVACGVLRFSSIFWYFEELRNHPTGSFCWVIWKLHLFDLQIVNRDSRIVVWTCLTVLRHKWWFLVYKTLDLCWDVIFLLITSCKNTTFSRNGACKFSIFKSKGAVKKQIPFHCFESYFNKNLQGDSGKHKERAVRILAHSEKFEDLPQKKRLDRYFLIVTVACEKWLGIRISFVVDNG